MSEDEVFFDMEDDAKEIKQRLILRYKNEEEEKKKKKKGKVKKPENVVEKVDGETNTEDDKLDEMLEGTTEQQKTEEVKDLKVKDLKAPEEVKDLKAPEEVKDLKVKNLEEFDETTDEEGSEGEYSTDEEGSEGEYSTTEEEGEEDHISVPLTGKKRTIDQIYDNDEYKSMQGIDYKKRMEHDRIIMQDLYQRCPYAIVSKNDLANLLDMKHYYPGHNQKVSQNFKTLTSSMLDMKKAVKRTVELGHEHRKIVVKTVIILSILMTFLVIINLLLFVFVGLEYFPMLKSILQKVITPSTKNSYVNPDGSVGN